MNRREPQSRAAYWIERTLAFALAFSPPLAALLAAILTLSRRERIIRLFRKERWTAGVFMLLTALGITSSLLGPSLWKSLEGLAGLGLIFLFWLAGRFAVGSPRRLWIDLQRAIGAVAALTLLAAYAHPTVRVELGSIDLTIVSPEKGATVLGLGAGGFGPLFAYGGILALGRAFHAGGVMARLEAAGIFGITLLASLSLGIRNALWGSVVGALALTPAVGPLAVVAVLLVSAAIFVLVPFATANFTVPFQSGIWKGLIALLQGGWSEERWESWRAAISMIQDRPLLGVGPRHFTTMRNSYLQNPVGEPDLGAHSDYLAMASEWGTPAALLLFGWFISWVPRIWLSRPEIWRWSLISGLVSFLAMGVFADPLFTFHISGAVLVGTGLAAAVEDTV